MGYIYLKLLVMGYIWRRDCSSRFIFLNFNIDLMAEIDSKQYEKESIRDVLIISFIGIIIFLLLVLYGLKVILGYNGLI